MFFSESKDGKILTSMRLGKGKGIVDPALDAKTGQRIGYLLRQLTGFGFGDGRSSDKLYALSILYKQPSSRVAFRHRQEYFHLFIAR
jgi:hypothetical protein